MLRFRLFGIPIEIAGNFWIGAVVLGLIGQSAEQRMLKLAVWVGCVFVSIIVHELGHALMGRRFGAQPRILLHGMGGLTFLPGAWLTRGRSILVSLAGPAFGLGLWLVARVTDDHVNLPDTTAGLAAYYALRYAIYINLYWTLFNLLPILPLDGGQVFREMLGPQRLQITRAVGATVGAFFCVLAALQYQIFMAIFLGALAFANFRGETRNLPGGVEKS